MRVRFPGGVVIQARGLSGGVSTHGDVRPQWGLYLDQGWAGRVPWESRLIDWPDFGVPREDEEHQLFEALVETWHRASSGESVEIACSGGTGRTGTALACLGVLAELPPAEAIQWVRSHYHSDAIETEAQAELVARFASAVGQPSAGPNEAALSNPETVDRIGAETLSLRDQLLSDLDRWEPELANWRGRRSTLWYGIFDKACKRFDRLLALVAAAWLAQAGVVGGEVLDTIGHGKSVDLLTMGQNLDLLRSLDKRRLLSPGRRVRRKADLKVLERVVDKRNAFEHGRLEYNNDAVDETLAFLSDLRALCHSPIIEREP